MAHEPPESIEKHVKNIKGFYINLTVYAAVFVGCIIAWLAMGGGAFWPIWVLLGCGIAAFSEAMRIGMLPVLSDILPFLKDDWEENKKKELMKQRVRDVASPTSPSEDHAAPVSLEKAKRK